MKKNVRIWLIRLYKSIFFVLSWEITPTRMKHKAYYFFVLAICSLVLFASSCRTDKPDIPVHPKSDVTVMIYGSGGGSLDRSMIGKVPPALPCRRGCLQACAGGCAVQILRGREDARLAFGGGKEHLL